MLDKVKYEIAGDDFREGLTAVISVKVMEPQFEGQTKTKLGNKEVTGAVDQAVGEMLNNYLEENPGMAKQIVRKYYWRHKRVMLRVKHAKWYNVKMFIRLRASWKTCRLFG